MFLKIFKASADLTLKVEPSNVTYIFDNEPRNKEIIKRMYDVIERLQLVVWHQMICDIKTSTI